MTIRKTHTMMNVPIHKKLARLAKVMASENDISRAKFIRQLILKEYKSRYPERYDTFMEEIGETS